MKIRFQNLFVGFFFLISIIIFFTSCKKKHDVHFHGNVTYKCNGQPAIGLTIQIYEVLESPSDKSSGVVGEGKTDNDGNYSFIASVTNEGTNSGYGITEAPPHGEGHGVFGINSNPGSRDGDSDVLLNGTATTAGNLICHIKNTNPFDNSDSFRLDFAWFVFDVPAFRNVISNLTGANVDTIISLLGSSDYDNIILYSSVKNGHYVEHKDTVIAGCLQDKNLDIFY